MKRMTLEAMTGAVPVGDIEITLEYTLRKGEAQMVATLAGLLDNEPVQIADIRGRVKGYKSVHDAVLQVADALQLDDGAYRVMVRSGDYLISEPALDIIAGAEKKKASLLAVRAKNVAYAGTLAAQLAAVDAWGTRTAALAARREELAAQIACLSAEVIAVDARVAELVAMIAAAG